MTINYIIFETKYFLVFIKFVSLLFIQKIKFVAAISVYHLHRIQFLMLLPYNKIKGKRNYASSLKIFITRTCKTKDYISIVNEVSDFVQTLIALAHSQ